MCKDDWQKKRDRERRVTVERYHQLKDLEEDFVIAKQVATTREERQRLMNDMAAYRRAHREEDVERGKRLLGGGVALHQVMWAQWIEVAVEHELSAREIYSELVAGNRDRLGEELRLSLVAVTASAATVEALHEDIVYLIPEGDADKGAAARTASTIAEAFGLDDPTARTTLKDLRWLFARRNEAIHPYSESEPPRPHPAGVNSSVETAKFNAVESCRAVDIAMTALAHAAVPPAPRGRWVNRWVTERQSYHTTTVDPLMSRRTAGRPERKPLGDS